MSSESVIALRIGAASQVINIRSKANDWWNSSPCMYFRISSGGAVRLADRHQVAARVGAARSRR